MFNTRFHLMSCFFLFASCFSISPAAAAVAGHKAYNDPAKAGESFARQGEYVGTVSSDEGNVQYAAQIIALGEGKFHLAGYRGGLPGAGWDGSVRIEMDGKPDDGAVVFENPEHIARAILKDGKLTVVDADGQELGVLKKVHRRSPTLGAKPPRGAVVLFDGAAAENFEKGRIVDGGLLAEGCSSKQKFGDHRLHLEFRTPFMPTATEQARGNSGCYVQGRYEVQILDSFGLTGKDNECGGIYNVAAPKINMCLPPLSWQTYDVDFTAPKYKDGKQIENARITVRHNGVVIHDDIELPEHTPGGLSVEGPGPLFLQDHGNPVRFRNIWVESKK